MKKYAALAFFIFSSLLSGYGQSVDSAHKVVDSTFKPVDTTKKRQPLLQTSVISAMTELEKQDGQTNQIIPRLENDDPLKNLQLQIAAVNASLADLQEDFNNFRYRINYRKMKSNYIWLNKIRLDLNRLRGKIAEEVTYNGQVDSLALAFTQSKIRYANFDMVAHPDLGRQYQLVVYKWDHIDTINKKNSILLEKIQGAFANDNLIVADRLREAYNKIEEFNDNLWNKDEPALFKARSANYPRSLGNVAKVTLSRNDLLFKYYLHDHAGFLVVTIIICLLFAFGLSVVIRKKRVIEANDQSGALYQQPFLSGMLVSFLFIPFILESPPLFFLDMIWAILGTIATLLIVNSNLIPGKLKYLWVVSFVIFIVLGATDVLIFVSLEERWLTAIINVCCIFIALYGSRLIKNYSFYNGRTAKILLTLFLLFSVGSLVYNVFGYFSIAKVFTIAGAHLVFSGVDLLLFTKICAQLLKMQFRTIQTKTSTFYKSEIDSLKRQFLFLLKAFSFILWVGILLNNLNVFDGLTTSLSTFLNDPIKLGKAVFTPSGVIIFFFIIWVAALISRIVSILTEYGYSINKDAFSNLKNSKLLLKIGIVSFGIIVAFASSGISVDKLAIIISALSVGIGFGLQGLINNLVSGIIISIEKPVRIGDSVELMGFSGVVREIGIRSSKIHASNGSDILIPNGQIISNALIKWTSNNKQRVIDISLVVKYETDLNKASNVISDVFKNSPAVLNSPQPIIHIAGIQSTGVNIKCYFWSEEARNWEKGKTKVLTDLYYAFKKEGIELA